VIQAVPHKACKAEPAQQSDLQPVHGGQGWCFPPKSGYYMVMVSPRLCFADQALVPCCLDIMSLECPDPVSSGRKKESDPIGSHRLWGAVCAPILSVASLLMLSAP